MTLKPIPPPAGVPAERVEIRAADIGFTLRTSDETLREIKEIEANSFRAALMAPVISSTSRIMHRALDDDEDGQRAADGC